MDESDINKKFRRTPVVELLEARTLYSADLLSALGGALLPDDQSETSSLIDLISQNVPAEVEPTDEHIELVFIDARVPDWQSIVDDIKTHKGESVTVFVISQEQSGVELVTQTLSQFHSVDAIHVISHSLGAGVRLGSDFLTDDSVLENADQFALWKSSFAQDADFLIYGCDLGSSTDGIALMNELASLTSADVAVSSNDTGHASLGADWELEQSTGKIETDSVVSADLQDTWEYVLDPWDEVNKILTVDYKEDQYFDGEPRYDSIEDLLQHAEDTGNPNFSLREAIAAANNDTSAPNVTIQLVGGAPYKLSIADTTAGVDDDLSATGDLDITRNLTIKGAGVDQTTIQAQTASGALETRVIDIHAGTVVKLSDLTIEAGALNGIGAGMRAYNSTLELSHVKFYNNTSLDAAGGGLFTQDTDVDLKHVQFLSNNAATHGAGYFAYNTLGGNAIGVTMEHNVFQDNIATGSASLGGALHLNIDATIRNSSFSGNSATDGGALYIESSRIVKTYSTDFTGNNATTGGAIASKGNLTLADYVTLTGNTAVQNGGGLHLTGNAYISDATFLNNTASNGDGGGVHSNNSNLYVTDSVFKLNKAPASHGGGLTAWGEVEIADSSFIQNSATYGGGVFFYQTAALKIDNNTFYNNSVTENGAAILLSNGTVVITNATIVDNTANGLYGAIAISKNTGNIILKNSIVSGNAAQNYQNLTGTNDANRQLDSGVITGSYVYNGVLYKGGFNLITEAPGIPEIEYQSSFNDISPTNYGTRSINLDLGPLTQSNGSNALHFIPGEDSDAIDSGHYDDSAGFGQLDGFGLLGNEFVDIGAVEHQTSKPTSKLFFVDENDYAIYRMNQNGGGLQMIVEGETLGSERKILDIAYDPKSRQLFYIRHTENALFENYDVVFASADGDVIDASHLNTYATFSSTGTYMPGAQYITTALAIEQVDTAGMPNLLYLAQHNMNDGTDSRIISIEIDKGIDTATNVPNIWLDMAQNGVSAINIVNLTTLPAGFDASNITSLTVTQDASGGRVFAWADNGNGATEQFVVVTDTGFEAHSLATPANRIEGIAYQASSDTAYLNARNDFAELNVATGSTGPTENWATPGSLRDVEINGLSDELWFAGDSAVTGEGAVGYFDNGTNDAPKEIPLDQSPVVFTMGTISAVNMPPVVALNKPLAVKEDEALKPITESELNYTDTGTLADTDPADIYYTIEKVPADGILTIDGNQLLTPTDPWPTDWHFTQQDINDGKVMYTHHGGENAQDSFEYFVSDGADDTDKPKGIFIIDVEEINDAPQVVLSPLVPLVAPTNQNLSLDENSKDTLLAEIIITDDDAIGDPTIKLVEVGTTTESAYVHLVNGKVVLQPNIDLNYELQPSFSFEVLVIDEDGATARTATTVELNDVNETPVFDGGKMVTANIDENQTGPLYQNVPTPTFLPPLSASDPESDALDYALVDTGPMSQNFWINPATNEVELKNKLSAEDISGDITLRISVTDQEFIVYQDIIVTINDVDEAPVHPTGLSELKVDENSLGPIVNMDGSPMTAIEWYDDDGETLSYQIINPTTEPASFFTLNADGTLQLNETLSHEDHTAPLVFRIKVDDGSGNGSEIHEVSVSVVNANEAPEFDSGPLVTANIDENETGELYLNTPEPQFLPALSATDPENDTLSFTLLDTGILSQNFWINPTTNKVELKNSLNAEEMTGPITLQIAVTDQEHTVVQDIVVTINDVNDAPTHPTSVSEFSVDENTLGPIVNMDGSSMTAIQWNDEDGDTLSYQIVNPGAEPASFFELNPDGTLQLKQTLNFEEHISPLVFDIEVTDGDVTQIHQVSVTINNKNEDPIITGPGTGQITENTKDVLVDSTGNAIQPFSGTDPEGLNISFSIKDTGGMSTWFSIDSNNQLRLDNEIDYETDPTSITLTIVASDGVNEIERSVLVNIVNENEVPTLNAPIADMQLSELKTLSFPIPTDTFIDQEDSTLTYFVSMDSNNWLTYNAFTQTLEGTPLDSDTNSTIGLEIWAVDSEGAQSLKQPFNITVNDVNQPPTAINLQPDSGEFIIPELTNGFVIGSLSTEDPDSTDNNHQYDIVGAGNQSRFEVTADGVLKLKENSALDLDVEQQIALSITSTDQAGKSVSQPFFFTVINVNEAPTASVPENIEVAENTTGTVIGQISPIDPDFDTTPVLSLTNLSGPTSTDFVLNRNNEIVQQNPLDFEQTQNVQLQIDVSDGELGNTYVINVVVRDVNESPVLAFMPQDLTTSADNPLDIASLPFVDPDNDTLTYSVTMANGAELEPWLELTEDNLLVVKDAPVEATTITLAIIANDGRAGETTQVFDIDIAAAPPPPAAALSPEPEPEPEPETIEVEETQVVAQPVTQTQATPSTTNEAPEEALEINGNIDTAKEETEIDLSSLIGPLEQINLVSLATTDNSIDSINRPISVDQIDSLDSGLGLLSLSDAFRQASDIEFEDLASEFDRQREELAEQVANSKTLIGSSFTISSGLSVGYLLWLIRGGTLMGSVLSSLPAWRLVDPLPVLGSLGDGMDDDEESLESMVDNDDQSDTDESNQSKTA